MSDSVRPHRRQPTRLPRPRDSPGKNTGVGCHCLLQCRKVKSESEVAESCPTLSNPMDCGPPGSSIHGIFQARVLEWGAIAFSVSVSTFPKGVRDLRAKFQPQFKFRIPQVFPHLQKALPKEDFKEWFSTEIKRWKEYCLIPVNTKHCFTHIGCISRVKSEPLQEFQDLVRKVLKEQRV